MTSFITPLITVASLCGGWLLGSVPPRPAAGPPHPRRFRDVVKTASGMIATLVALVIGLLGELGEIAFDQANDGLTQAGAKADPA